MILLLWNVPATPNQVGRRLLSYVEHRKKCYTEILADKATKGILMESHTDDLLAILHDVEAPVEGGNASNAMVKLPLLPCHTWRIQS